MHIEDTDKLEARKSALDSALKLADMRQDGAETETNKVLEDARAIADFLLAD
jgi:hypothetical protein